MVKAKEIRTEWKSILLNSKNDSKPARPDKTVLSKRKEQELFKEAEDRLKTVTIPEPMHKIPEF